MGHGFLSVSPFILVFFYDKHRPSFHGPYILYRPLYDPHFSLLVFPGSLKQRKSGARPWLASSVFGFCVSTQFQTEIDKQHRVSSRYYTITIMASSKSSWFNAGQPEITSKSLGKSASV